MLTNYRTGRSEARVPPRTSWPRWLWAMVTGMGVRLLLRRRRQIAKSLTVHGEMGDYWTRDSKWNRWPTMMVEAHYRRKTFLSRDRHGQWSAFAKWVPDKHEG